VRLRGKEGQGVKGLLEDKRKLLMELGPVLSRVHRWGVWDTW
jgi:hypothetical protein